MARTVPSNYALQKHLPAKLQRARIGAAHAAFGRDDRVVLNPGTAGAAIGRVRGANVYCCLNLKSGGYWDFQSSGFYHPTSEIRSCFSPGFSRLAKLHGAQLIETLLPLGAGSGPWEVWGKGLLQRKAEGVTVGWSDGRCAPRESRCPPSRVWPFGARGKKMVFETGGAQGNVIGGGWALERYSNNKQRYFIWESRG